MTCIYRSSLHLGAFMQVSLNVLFILILFKVGTRPASWSSFFFLLLSAEFNVQLSFHGLNTFVLSEQWKQACSGRKGSPLGEKLYFHNQELRFLVQVQVRINELAAGLSSPELQFEVSGTFQGVRWNFWLTKPQAKTSLRTPSWPTFTWDFFVTFLKIAWPNSDTVSLRDLDWVKLFPKPLLTYTARTDNQCSIVFNFTW